MTALERGATPPLSGREMLESVGLLIGLGFSAVVFTELSERLRRRLLTRMKGR